MSNAPIKTPAGGGDGSLWGAAALIAGAFAVYYFSKRMPVEAPPSDGFARDREALSGDFRKVAGDMHVGVHKAEAHAG